VAARETAGSACSRARRCRPVGSDVDNLDRPNAREASNCSATPRRQFFEWLEKADGREEGIYSDFSDRVASARGAARRPGDTQDRRRGRTGGDRRARAVTDCLTKQTQPHGSTPARSWEGTHRRRP
jgi:hypothetical protein